MKRCLWLGFGLEKKLIKFCWNALEEKYLFINLEILYLLNWLNTTAERQNPY